MNPIRIQRKRTKGFDLQAVSLAINGLTAVYVGRSTKWGNPYKVTDLRTVIAAVMAYEVALLEVKVFGEAIPPKPWANKIIADLDELRDKNLACWCKLTDECHADVLWELVHRVIPPGRRWKMRNSTWQLMMGIGLSMIGAMILALTGEFQPIWFVGAAIVLAIMGLTMEMERKG